MSKFKVKFLLLSLLFIAIPLGAYWALKVPEIVVTQLALTKDDAGVLKRQNNSPKQSDTDVQFVRLTITVDNGSLMAKSFKNFIFGNVKANQEYIRLVFYFAELDANEDVFHINGGQKTTTAIIAQLPEGLASQYVLDTFEKGELGIGLNAVLTDDTPVPSKVSFFSKNGKDHIGLETEDPYHFDDLILQIKKAGE